jgi:hypothetical protein
LGGHFAFFGTLIESCRAYTANGRPFGACTPSARAWQRYCFAPHFIGGDYVARLRIVFLAAGFVCACAGGLAAEPIQVMPARFISGQASFTDPTGVGFSDFFGQRTGELGRFVVSDGVTVQSDTGLLSLEASQATTVTAMHFAGTGSASAHAQGEFGELLATWVQSDIAVPFDLSERMAYRFTGALSASGDSFAQAALEGLGGWSDGSFGGTTSVDRTGVLMPGRYLFFAHAGTFEPPFTTLAGEAAFNIDFSLSAAATPEPATWLLLATAVIASATRNRLRKKVP